MHPLALTSCHQRSRTSGARLLRQATLSLREPSSTGLLGHGDKGFGNSDLCLQELLQHLLHAENDLLGILKQQGLVVLLLMDGLVDLALALQEGHDLEVDIEV